MQGRRPKSPRTVTRSWSATGADIARACSLRYLYEVILPEPGPENPEAVFGKAVHYLLQRFLNPNRSTGRFPYETENDLQGAWKGLWWGAVNGRNPFDSLERFDGKKNQRRTIPWQPTTVRWQHSNQPGQLYARGIHVMRMFYRIHHHRRTDGTIRLVERRFNGMPWHGLVLNGVIDRIDVQPHGAYIVDYKNQWFEPWLLDSTIQLTFYQLGYEHLRENGAIPYSPPLKGMYYYHYGRGLWQSAPLRSAFEIGVLRQILLMLRAYWDVVLFNRSYPTEMVGAFSPALIRDMACGDASPNLPRGNHCRYCQAVQKCDAWKSGQLKLAREVFAAFHQLRRSERMDRQTLLPVYLDPALRAWGEAELRRTARLFPEQPQFGLETPVIHAPRRRRKKAPRVE